jgi:hypothetical protein
MKPNYPLIKQRKYRNSMSKEDYLLLTPNQRLTSRDSSGYIPLHHAAGAGDPLHVIELLRHRPEDQVVCTTGRTGERSDIPLHITARHGDLTLASLLLAVTPELQLTTRNLTGDFPLETALMYYQYDVAALCIACGAPSIYLKPGPTPYKKMSPQHQAYLVSQIMDGKAGGIIPDIEDIGPANWSMPLALAIAWYDRIENPLSQFKPQACGQLQEKLSELGLPEGAQTVFHQALAAAPRLHDASAVPLTPITLSHG